MPTAWTGSGFDPLNQGRIRDRGSSRALEAACVPPVRVLAAPREDLLILLDAFPAVAVRIIGVGESPTVSIVE